MIHTILKSIDKVLPPDIWTSKDRVLRTRVIVFVLSLEICVLLLKVIFPPPQEFFTPWFKLLYVAFDIVCLYLIKKSFDIGKIIGLYIISVLTPFSYNILTLKVEATTNRFILLPIMILMTMLVSNGKTRIVLFALIMGLTLSFLQFAPIQFPDRINASSILIFVFFSISLIYIYSQSRSIMQDDLDREIEWQFRDARLAEISSMTRTMHSLMAPPLKAFSDERLNLARRAAPSDREILLDKMQQQIDELVCISQSYSWMYRAFQKESDYSASTDELVAQLQTLLRLSFEEGGWEWKSKPKAEPIEISGPIPSLMLLLFCIIIQIVENKPIQGLNFVQLEVSRTDKWVNWIFTWPEDGGRKPIFDWTVEDALSLGSMRKDLIQDLQKSCGAKLLEYQQGTLRVLKVSGMWGRMAFSTSLA